MTSRSEDNLAINWPDRIWAYANEGAGNGEWNSTEQRSEVEGLDPVIPGQAVYLRATLALLDALAKAWCVSQSGDADDDGPCYVRVDFSRRSDASAVFLWLEALAGFGASEPDSESNGSSKNLSAEGMVE